MRQNRSYIFFREATELAPEDGPIGGAGTPLTARPQPRGRPDLWPYGLPFWLEGELPDPDAGRAPAAADDRSGYRLGHRGTRPRGFLLRQRPRGGHPRRPPAPRGPLRGAAEASRPCEAGRTRPLRSAGSGAGWPPRGVKPLWGRLSGREPPERRAPVDRPRRESFARRARAAERPPPAPRAV